MIITKIKYIETIQKTNNTAIQNKLKQIQIP